jgi:hypothetical protein
VVDILRDPESHKPEGNPAQRLVKEAVEKSGRDNTTALIIEVI